MSKILEEVKEELVKRGFYVEETEVAKRNMVLKGILIYQQDETAVPIYYENQLEEMAEHIGSIEALADSILDSIEASKASISGWKAIDSPEFVLENVKLVICREEWNRELLEKTCSEKIEGTDLCIYPVVSSGMFMAKITNGFLENAGLTEDEVFKRAKENMLNDVELAYFSPMDGFSCEKPEEIMAPIVITNQEHEFGASVIFDRGTLDRAKEMVGTEQVYLIPSSVHEWMAIPVCMDTGILNQMINDVNETCVSRQDILSDHAYMYDGEKLVSL